MCICFRSELPTVSIAMDGPDNNSDMDDHVKGDKKKNVLKKTSFSFVLADILQSPDFSTKFECFLDQCGDVNAGHKNGKTLLHYIAKYAQGSSNMSSSLRQCIFE